jgi:hypothetical protein
VGIGIGTAWEGIVGVGEGEDVVEVVVDEEDVELVDGLSGDAVAAGERGEAGCRGLTAGCWGLTAEDLFAAAELWAGSGATAGGAVGTKIGRDMEEGDVDVGVCVVGD